MKQIALALATLLAVGGCASAGRLSDTETLALYKAHAGAPVSSFNFFGRLDSWTPLDNRTLAVWTKPRQAYLLTLFGPCNDLQYTPVIGLTSQMGQVTRGFDKVLVRGGGVANVPCAIQTIQPLDVSSLKQAERGARDAKAAAAQPPSSGT